MNENHTANPGRAEKKLMKCEDIQPMIFDYMNHELGEGRSAVTREHIRKCKACQEIAKNMQSALDLLQKASKTPNLLTERLTDSRRKKILWTFTHPVRSWIEKHLFAFSFIAAILAFAALFSFSRLMVRTHFAPPEGKVIEVILVTSGRTSVVYDETKRWSSGGHTNQLPGGTNTAPPGGGNPSQ